MTENEVIQLMESTQTEQEWDDNCDRVKAVFNGDYPSFWFRAILASGLADRVLKRVGNPNGAAITVTTYDAAGNVLERIMSQ